MREEAIGGRERVDNVDIDELPQFVQGVGSIHQPIIVLDEGLELSGSKAR